MNERYILDGKNPVPCDSLKKWGRWMENGDRRVARTEFAGGYVSTVFLGLDHSFGFEGMPILFESMIFGGVLDGEGERYETWAQAEAGHKRLCKKIGVTP